MKLENISIGTLKLIKENPKGKGIRIIG